MPRLESPTLENVLRDWGMTGELDPGINPGGVVVNPASRGFRLLAEGSPGLAKWLQKIPERVLFLRGKESVGQREGADALFRNAEAGAKYGEPFVPKFPGIADWEIMDYGLSNGPRTTMVHEALHGAFSRKGETMGPAKKWHSQQILERFGVPRWGDVTVKQPKALQELIPAIAKQHPDAMRHLALEVLARNIVEDTLADPKKARFGKQLAESLMRGEIAP